MQQEPMRSPDDQEIDQEILGENDSDFLLSSAQEAAMLSAYGNDDDASVNLVDPEDDSPEPIETLRQNIQPDIKPSSGYSNSFHNHYVGYMDLLADQVTVMKYLDAHQGWFRRCAHPFKADPIGETGYAMGVGKVGAMGFQVDARVGLNLLPPDENFVYRITTIPIPNQPPQGYEVDFQAEMRLKEQPLESLKELQLGQQNLVITSVEWDLHLTVSLQFPNFIQRISADILQKTGDSVLGFVVQRVSKSLTAKVQDDFHKTHTIKVPKQVKLKR
ncbi:DUF1997 domain-containing protein [Pseudanabaena sp. FACHB-1277]|uniref:DUF1997 domain-containing protein n=1 Tax=Pseudanabaena cinerea FACHB-1277 TaxID=2949581 RepID=A0A926UW14_9CYAN|nr:DUF1997 domain-containing protein [Pseudanabaena cinerea]MBD2152282.1 DUF1997 domain-containing protein [Pseudanabaena cinerea FACHB-1277]